MESTDDNEQKEMEKESNEQKVPKVKKKAKHEVKKEEHAEHSEEKQEEHQVHHEMQHEEPHHEVEHEHHHEHEEKSMWSEMGTWRFIAVVAAMLLVVSIFTNGFSFNGIKTTLSKEEAVQKTLDFVNVLQPDLGVTASGSEDVGDLYKIDLAVAGQQFESYMTKDGRLLFPQGFDLLNAPPNVSEAQTAPVVDVSADDDPVKGNADAPVTIIEFSDFQCPFCARFFSDTLPQIEENYIKTGKVKLVYRDFPLDNIHLQATPAAQAAECADEQGKFYEYHDKLFENQQLLSTDNYKKWAEELGLDTDQFNGCVDSKKYASEVAKDSADGSAAGVTGTPAFFINGKYISGAQPFSVFEALIEAELDVEGDANNDDEDNNDELAPAAVAAPSAAETVSITAKKFRFVPNEFTVSKGATVELSVKSTDVDFGFELPDFGVSLKLVPGETATAEFVADKTGEFTFSCSDCEGKEEIMTGKLVVE